MTGDELSLSAALMTILTAFAGFIGILFRMIWVRFFDADKGYVSRIVDAHIEVVKSLKDNLAAQTAHTSRQTEILARIEANTVEAIRRIKAGEPAEWVTGLPPISSSGRRRHQSEHHHEGEQRGDACDNDDNSH